MKYRIVMLSACLCVAAALAAARVVTGQEAQEPKTQAVTLTGCVVQGTTGHSVFILENAKADPSDSSEKGRSYVLASSGMSISFREHLNHEVRISGMAETKLPPTPPMGESVKESELPRLTAATITHVASTCSPPIG